MRPAAIPFPENRKSGLRFTARSLLFYRTDGVCLVRKTTERTEDCTGKQYRELLRG